MKSIKSYNNFLKESKESVAQKIASLAQQDSYAQYLVSTYCKDVDPTVDLVSAISLLNGETQNQILNSIQKYRKFSVEEEPIIVTHTDLNLLESEGTLAGKNLFNCFLKILTALGYKNIQPNWENTGAEFLILYTTDELSYLDIRMVTSRFKYLDEIIEKLSFSTQIAKLYFGLRTDLCIEYGIIFEESPNKIGEFKFNKPTLNCFLHSNYLALNNFRSLVNNLDFEKIKLLCKIKVAMEKFNPGYFESKSKPIITDNIFTFGYFGVGRWDNGIMEEYEVESVKNNLKNYLIQFKWSCDIKISVTAREFWVYINFKLK